MLLVKDWMTKAFVTLYEDQTLGEAVSMLSDNSELHALPVVNVSDQVKGMVSKDEIINGVMHHADLETKIHIIMKREWESIQEDAPIEEASRREHSRPLLEPAVM